jgi:hypothetical protein
MADAGRTDGGAGAPAETTQPTPAEQPAVETPPAAPAGEGEQKPTPETPAEPELDPVQRAAAEAQAALANANGAISRMFGGAERTFGERVLVIVGEDDLRRGFYTVGRLGSMLQDLAYVVADAKFEAEIEGDGSPVPAKLRDALKALATAYKAMSDEELAELLKGVDVDIAFENGIILLAQSGADLERADRPALSEELLGRFGEAHAAMLARGWAPPAIELVDTPPDDLARALASVGALTEQNETLMRTVGELTTGLNGLASQFEAFRDSPAPAKTAGSLARAVGKEEDGGAAAGPAAPTSEDIQRHIDSLPAAERVHLLTRMALRTPQTVTP